MKIPSSTESSTPSRGAASAASPRVAVVLAAGKGRRMGTDRPKVLARAAGRPLLAHVLDIARRVPCDRIAVIVGHGADAVRAELAGPDIDWVVQEQQLGTGHALACVADRVPRDAVLLVLSGDVPLLRVATARRLLELAEGAWGAMAVADLDDPGSLGRVVVNADGDLSRSVEAADATPDELRLKTVNSGIYALPASEVFDYVARVRPDNAQGEIYLPDALNLAAQEGRAVRCLALEDPDEALGVNTPSELADIERRMLARAAETPE